ncbi:MAG: AAA family ATPase, partial [Candidatus Promineifilaceae bacterium]
MTAEADTREQAVALYRGAFLMGFSLASCPEFDLWLTEEQGKYEAELLNTLAELVRIKESQGKYRTAIEYAQKYLSVDKLAEEMHRQLITLYNAHGNRSGALKQYEICVTELERELGVSPLPETRAAYAAVLRGERSKARLPIPKPAWRELPSLQLPLMGREAAWRALKQAYRTLRTVGLILILGEAGIGKTRLMRQFVMDDSHTVLIGNGHAPTRSLPYYPLVQALRQALLYSQLWIDIPSLWLGEITPLLPDLNDYFNGLPSTLEFEPEHAQSRLFEALTQVIFGLASQDHPLILCLDDLHWADEATLGWLSAVSSRLPGSQVCIFATSRQEEPDSIQSVRQAYQRAGLYAEVSLNGISFRAIGDLLKHVSGDKKVSATLAARLARITGGNPFFILETVKALLESGQMDEAEEQLPLPKTVRETIQTRLMRLTLLARQILDAAAVLSPTLEPVLLRETSGRTEHEVADGLDELTRHQILQDEAGGLTFHHELARMVVYQMLTPWRRSLLHRRAAEALAEVYRKNPDPVISQIAQHYDAAGKLEKAVASYYQAALVSRRVYAHGEVIEYLQRALKLFSTTTLKWPKLIKFYEHLGESLTIVGNYETALKAYRDCLDCIPLAAYLPRVKIKTKLATTCDRLNLFDKAKEICRDALLELEANSDDRHIEWQQAWLDIHLAKLELFYRQAKSKEMQALLQEIQPVIEHAGTPEQRARFYEQHTAYRLRQDRYVVSAEIVLSI